MATYTTTEVKLVDLLASDGVPDNAALLFLMHNVED